MEKLREILSTEIPGVILALIFAVGWLLILIYIIFFTEKLNDVVILLVFLVYLLIAVLILRWLEYLHDELNHKHEAKEKFNRHKEEAERKFNVHKEAALAAGIEPRTDFYFVGPPVFMQAVNRVLEELKQKTPDRYYETIKFLPKAEYVPHMTGFLGRPDGLFTIDGSNYEMFRWVFMHEVGHCVHIACGNESDELSAKAYADHAELEFNSWEYFHDL